MSTGVTTPVSGKGRQFNSYHQTHSMLIIINTKKPRRVIHDEAL